MKQTLAIILVAALVTTSMVMIFTPSIEELPEGDLPTFVSETQLRNFLNERHEEQGNYSNMEGATGADYHSKTNVQVSGVDELDTMKTDGELLYIASSAGVSVVKATPAESLSNVSALSIADLTGSDEVYGYVQGLFINGGMLAVVVNVYDVDTSDMPDSAPFNFSYYWVAYESVTCCLVDMTDPYLPQVMNRYSISGYYVGARMIDDNVYLIGQDNIWTMGEISLPQVGVDDDMKDIDATNIHFDPRSDDAGYFLNILALDLATFENNFTSILTGYSSVLYVSQANMYLTYTSNANTLSDIGSFADDAIVTTVFRLSIDGIEVIPCATGYVEGHPINQFSLDEFDGILRMAVNTGWSDGDNRVYTLDQDLNLIGSLIGIAPGETLQSSRFLGTTLYLVTYFVTDPLFVIDLSDPNSPEVVGELLVPGFSTYLHPCSDDLIAGIGQDNWTLKVSLFNVSDPASPAEVDTIMAPLYAWSEALWDHKAVLFDERDDTLFIPVFGWDAETYTPRQEVYIIQIGEEGLTLRANLSIEESYGQVRCSIIGDVLYTITSSEVTAWDLGTLNELDRLTYCSTAMPNVIEGGERI